MRARAQAGVAEVTQLQRASSYHAHEDPIGPVPYVHHRTDRGLYELRGLALLDARERAVAARQQVQDRIVDWSQAAQRVEALERLDNRRRDEHRRDAERESEREVDDLVTGRFGRGRGGTRLGGRVPGSGNDNSGNDVRGHDTPSGNDGRNDDSGDNPSGYTP
jgi:hypothetical protein